MSQKNSDKNCPEKESTVAGGKLLKKLSNASQQYLDLLKEQKAGLLSASDTLRLNEIEQRPGELEIDRAKVESILTWLFNQESCIAGLACPVCGRHESFIIEVPILLQFGDEGEQMDEPYCDRCWTDASYCRCPECSHEGKVREFRAECPLYTTDTPDNSGACLACAGTGLRHPNERSVSE